MTTSSLSIIKKLLITFMILFGLYFAKDFLIPLCIGGILATLFLPFCNWMENKKIPKTIAVLLCLLVLLGVIFSFFSLMGFKISALLSDLVSIKQKVIETFTAIQDYIFLHLNISINDQFKILRSEQPSYSNIMQLMLGSLGAFLTAFILVVAYFVFLLLYRNHLKDFLLKMANNDQRHEMEQIISSASKISQNYLFGLLKMIFLLWIMYSVGFSIIGVENAIFFAILCGFLEIIPYLGNIVGTALTVLIAGINGANAELLVGIVVIYGIIQLIQTWIFEPLILGPQVKINPLFTIIGLVIGELLWGIPGLILAIPIMAMIKIVCDHIESMKPYGFLIGEIPDNTSKIGFIERIKTNLLKVLNK